MSKAAKQRTTFSRATSRETPGINDAFYLINFPLQGVIAIGQWNGLFSVAKPVLMTRSCALDVFTLPFGNGVEFERVAVVYQAKRQITSTYVKVLEKVIPKLHWINELDSAPTFPAWL